MALDRSDFSQKMSLVDFDKIENDGNVNNVQFQLNQSMQIGLDRFSMFNICVKNAIDKISSGVSEDEYLNLFGKLSALKNSKSAPLKMHKRMKNNIKESLTSEIEEMVEDEKLQDKCQQLEILVDECALDEGKETWRPNGNVHDHLRSHIMAVQIQRKIELEKYVKSKEQSSKILREQVSALRSQVRSTELRLKNLQDCCLNSSVDSKINDKISEYTQHF